MKLNFSPEVLSALTSKSPIVALESTIITHGLSYPQNLQTALSVESVIRSHNAIPATIAIILGQIHIGLTTPQIDYLAQQGGKVRKCSRRDLAACIAK
jgi:pseudouridine-5'-phosphate glycosidase